jgi:NAD-dependent DNA ligase
MSDKIDIQCINGSIITKLGDLKISFTPSSEFTVENKGNIIFELSPEEIESFQGSVPSSSESYLISGIMIWLKRIGYEYIFELAKLTMDKKPEQIAVPKPVKAQKPKPKKVVPKPHIIKDKVIVFSGFRDNLMERLIIQKGGAIANSVGYNTDYLVIPDVLRRDITTKINKANRFGVEIKRRTQFVAMLNS